MHCFHCGDCCLRMPILSAQKPCPHLVSMDNFYFCGCYDNRPEECSNLYFSSKVCPIGSSVLGIHNSEKMRQRLDTGRTLLKHCGEDIATVKSEADSFD